MKKYYMTHPNWKNYIHHNQSDQLQNRRYIYKLKKQLKPTTYTYTKNLLLNKKHTRTYPLIEIGDKVKIYRKKRTGEKERASHWSENSYEVEKIIKGKRFLY